MLQQNPRCCVLFYGCFVRFQEFDLDSDGTLGRREFLRALNLALEEDEDGNREPLGFPEDSFMTEEEAVSLVGSLDTNRDGRVCWEASIQYYITRCLAL